MVEKTKVVLGDADKLKLVSKYKDKMSEYNKDFARLVSKKRVEHLSPGELNRLSQVYSDSEEWIQQAEADEATGSQEASSVGMADPSQESPQEAPTVPTPSAPEDPRATESGGGSETPTADSQGEVSPEVSDLGGSNESSG